MSAPRNATTTARGRYYTWKGERFDSVTTIIGGGMPKPALKAWGERLVAETAFRKLNTWRNMTEAEAIDWLKRAPFRETDRAAVQGSDIHDWCESYVLGQLPQVDDAPEPQQPYLKGYLSFLAEWRPRFEMSEASVFNRRCGYAGTLDFLAWIDLDHVREYLVADGFLQPNAAGEVLVLGDYKTGKGVYSEVAAQLAAYRFAEFIGQADGTEVPMPDVAACAVVHLTPTGYELIPVRADESTFRYFLYAQQVRTFCESVAHEVLGTPLSPRSATVPPRPTYPPNVAALVE